MEIVFGFQAHRSKTGAPPQLELSLGPAPDDWLAQE
jgi:hypothetical protein